MKSLYLFLILVIVGFYDLAIAFNRRNQEKYQFTNRLYTILGVIFILAGILGWIFNLL
ncbi:MAG: hypothetical protein Q3960_03365 [Lactobacillus sp.]|nr:hypothetical protein [Lactobacillus sp.]